MTVGMDFAYEISPSYLSGFLIYRKMLRGTDGFSSSTKAVVIWIFIATKSLSSSAGF